MVRCPKGARFLTPAGDLDLARASAAGDVAAFTELVRRHELRVSRFLDRVTRGVGADDLRQETFLRAWRLASSFRGKGSYAGWLLRIAWREYLRHLDRTKHEADAPKYETDEPSYSPQPGDVVDVNRALAALGPRERAAALLCLGEGFSHEEAAQILDLPLGTLKSIVARAKRQLTHYLEGERP